MKLLSQHSGADWLKSAGINQVSPLGEKVADLLGVVFKGIYHIGDDVMNKKTDWSNPLYIALYFHGELATWDFNNLTELVLLAHEMCIRVAVRPHSPQNLLLLFHQRSRQGTLSQRHPTIEEHVAGLRKCYTLEP